MTDTEIATMFGSTPRTCSASTTGAMTSSRSVRFPATSCSKVSEGKLDYPWPAQVNKLLRDGGHDSDHFDRPGGAA